MRTYSLQEPLTTISLPLFVKRNNEPSGVQPARESLVNGEIRVSAIGSETLPIPAPFRQIPSVKEVRRVNCFGDSTVSLVYFTIKVRWGESYNFVNYLAVVLLA